mmetsp:Transcript_5051/g.14623  ORF Transcript_5051/g.14623 Transcript_5051/m.14623 type:complete len:275 (+) Transcript_5051:199-1023(+)
MSCHVMPLGTTDELVCCRRLFADFFLYLLGGGGGGGGLCLRLRLVSVRIRRLPLPGILAHFLDAVLRLPFQEIVRQLRVRVHLGDVSGPPIHDAVRNRLAGGLAHPVHQVQDGDPPAGSQIDRLAAQVGGRVQLFESGHVAPRQVHHVNVIPDTGAVGGVVVAPKDTELGSPTDADLRDKGHQIVGDSLWVFPDAARGVGADGVEVSKDQHVPFLGGRGVGVPENLLDEEFRSAVRIRGRQPSRFPEGEHLGFSVDGGGRAKNEMADLVLLETV